MTGRRDVLGRGALAGVALSVMTTCVMPPVRPAMAEKGSEVAAPAAPQAATPPAPVTAAGPFALGGPAIQGNLIRGRLPAGARDLTLDGAAVEVAADGAFVIAFDRDAGPEAVLAATGADGRAIVDRLSVAKRAWRIENLATLPRTPVPSADFSARRPGELARINAARAQDNGDPGGWRQPFVWPAAGRISGLFGSQRIYRGEPGAYHSGVDIAKPAGAPVVAPADGVVILAADPPFTLEGRLLMIDHGMGLNSAFLHLSRIDVRVGERVRQGQLVGAVGATGRATGPHLHWAMKWGAARIDPLLVAGPMPVAANR